MSIQSEAALEAGLIATLQQMGYEYVQIAEEDNLQANFKRQLEIHNRKRLAEHGRTGFTDEEFDKILIYLEGGTRFEKAKKLRDLYPLDTADGKRIWVETHLGGVSQPPAVVPKRVSGFQPNHGGRP